MNCSVLKTDLVIYHDAASNGMSRFTVGCEPDYKSGRIIGLLIVAINRKSKKNNYRKVLKPEDVPYFICSGILKVNIFQ